MTCLYSQDELITKIKSLDTELESSITQSRLDSGQGVSSYQVSIEKLTEQRNRYYRMLQQCYPGNYAGILKLNAVRCE